MKVYGTIRVFKEEKAIVGTHIKRVDKFDEVCNHLLQVFVSHAIRKKGVLSGNALNAEKKGIKSQPGNAADQKNMVLSLMQELQKKDNQRFVHKKDLIERLAKAKVGEAELERALNELCEDGVIHSTYHNDVYSITTD